MNNLLSFASSLDSGVAPQKKLGNCNERPNLISEPGRPELYRSYPAGGKIPLKPMKGPHQHSERTRLLISAIATSITILVSPFGSQAKEHVDVQFWDMIWGGPEYIDAGKALVAQFNQEHPDITVTYRSVPWTNWYQTFLTAIGSGTAPDISTGAGYQAVQLYDQDAILPIDDVISQLKADGKLDDFLPKTVDILKYKDHYVALPWAIDIRVWYYRKDLLEQAHVQPPGTWQELKTAAQDADELQGRPVRLGRLWGYSRIALAIYFDA